jgi:hypothetical protein
MQTPLAEQIISLGAAWNTKIPMMCRKPWLPISRKFRLMNIQNMKQNRLCSWGRDSASVVAIFYLRTKVTKLTYNCFDKLSAVCGLLDKGDGFANQF